MGIYQLKAVAVNQTEAVYWMQESNVAESHPELLRRGLQILDSTV